MQRVAPIIWTDSAIFHVFLYHTVCSDSLVAFFQRCTPQDNQIACNCVFSPNAQVIITTSHATHLNWRSHPGRQRKKVAFARKAGHPAHSIIQTPSICVPRITSRTSGFRACVPCFAHPLDLAWTIPSQHGACTRRPPCAQTWHHALR